MMKKLLILTAILCALALALTSCNLFNRKGKLELEFTSNGDGTCYVSGIGTCTDTNIVVPTVSPDGNAVTSIGSFAFDDCDSLTSIEIPASVTSIGSSAFRDCDSLTNIKIPASVTYIGQEAFFGCDSLTSIEIPASVTYIGDSPFSSCFSLTEIKVAEGNGKYKDINGNLYSYDGTELIQYAPGKTDSTFDIPDGVTTIGDEAFFECYLLTSIEIPASVTTIGDEAFFECCLLTSIEIPASVTSIGNYAFSWCKSLTSIEIPASVTSIGKYAFEDCTSLYKVTNNSELVFEFESSDYGCVAEYAKVMVDKDGNKTYNNTEATQYIETDDNFLFWIEDGEHALIAYTGSEETITLPNYFNGIKYEIYQMRGVSKVVISESFNSVGYGAFSGCYSLTSIEIPDSITYIGDCAFEECYLLTSIEMPASVTSIGSAAFQYCASLTSIEIPESVTSIGDWAFGDCDSLTSIEIPASVTSIGKHAFSSCSSLTSIEIPASVTFIGREAFQHCYSLTDVYYVGNKAEWTAISIADGNDRLTNATIHYNCVPEE